MLRTAGPRQDRHHAGDAAAPRDAQHVSLDVGMKRRAAERRDEAEPRVLDAAGEEPLAHAATRLLLHHEREPLGAAVEVHHRVGTRARDAGHGEERELAGGEIERRVDLDVEGGDVVRQPTKPLDHPAHRPRHRCVGLARFQRADLEGAILAGNALAGEQIALSLEILPARRLGPGALRAPAREPRLARAARPRGALVRQLDTAAQAGEEDLLARVALEVARAVARGDDDLHTTTIFAWRSGEASASNACATPSIPTRPVISGVVGMRPSAMWPSVAANSSCV